MATLDPDIQVQGALNHCLWVIFADEEVRNRLGYKYVSHMYDTSHYWYVWFTDLPGVFRFELQSSRLLPPSAWEAHFILKYYPHTEEECFRELSICEQFCRSGETFQTRAATWTEGERCPCHGGCSHEGQKFADLAHGTGVPCGTLSQAIPPDFFFTGLLFLRHQEGCSTLEWESQDRWRVVMTTDYFLPDWEGRPLKVLRKGDVDRNFPGWPLTDLFGRRLAAGWQYLFGYSAAVRTYAEENGCDFAVDGEKLLARPADDIRKYKVCLEMR